MLEGSKALQACNFKLYFVRFNTITEKEFGANLLNHLMGREICVTGALARQLCSVYTSWCWSIEMINKSY